VLSPPARLVAPSRVEHIFNQQFDFFLLLVPLSARAAAPYSTTTAEEEEYKIKNQARRLQCLINTGSRRVCNAAQPTGCESDRSYSSSGAPEESTTTTTTTIQYSPLLSLLPNQQKART
jgi:hypothetical protein